MLLHNVSRCGGIVNHEFIVNARVSLAAKICANQSASGEVTGNVACFSLTVAQGTVFFCAILYSYATQAAEV